MAASFAYASVTTVYTDNVMPFVGADFEYSIINPHNDWRNFFSRVFPGGNGFVGVRLSEYIGFELGYDFTGKKEKTHEFIAGETFFNFPSPVLVGTTVHSKISFNGWHLDLLGFVPLDHCIDLLLTVGYSATRAKLQFDVGTVGNPTLLSIIPTLNARGRTFLRLGGGIQWMVTDMTGVRALVRWKNTNRINFRNTPGIDFLVANYGVSRTLYKDAVTVAVGVFFRFF
jgi:hypothetical protein